MKKKKNKSIFLHSEWGGKQKRTGDPLVDRLMDKNKAKFQIAFTVTFVVVNILMVFGFIMFILIVMGVIG